MTGAADSLRRTLVVGLGNPILGDDGVGWRIAEEVSRRSGIPVGDAPLRGPQTSHREPVTIECYSLAGLSLMERLIGYDRVILVDALLQPGIVPGAITRLTLDDLEAISECPVVRPAIVAVLPQLKEIAGYLLGGKDGIGLLVTETASGPDLHVTGLATDVKALARA
jgi:hydrogenase maturation protease